MQNSLHSPSPGNANGAGFGSQMLRRFGLAVGVSLLAMAGVQAQTASTYQFSASTTTFTPTTGGTGVTGINTDDTASPVMPIGFTFPYQGVSYTTFQASSNGYLGLGSALNGTLDANLSGTNPGTPSLAPFIGDLRGDLGGATAQYVVTGTAPNRVLTMEWLNWGTFPSPANVISFQAKLYETSGRIEYVYRQDANALPANIGIGLWGAAGNYLSLSNASAAPTASSAAASTFSTRPATGQKYTFIPAFQWTGAVDSNWSTAGNWSNSLVPTSTNSVYIPVVTNQPVVTGSQVCAFLTVASGATLTLASNALLTTSNSISLASTATLVQQAGSELRIGQDLSNAGGIFTLDPTSLVSFRAATATTHNLTGTGTSAFQNLSLGQQAASDQMSIQGTATVQRLLTLAQASTATVAAGGSFTLLSNATATGQIAKDAASAVTGTVTVQRYITPTLNAGAGYRHYSAPITNATTNSLTTAGFTPTLNTAYNSSATPNLVTPFPTVFGFNEARVGTITSAYTPFDQGYLSPASGDALVEGRSYTVNIPASQTVNFTGTLENGTVTLSGLTRGANAQSGWQLLGNPYASVIDADVVASNSTGMDAATYVYQSTGQYVGQYVPYVNGVGTGHTIASSQGFFKRVTSAGTPGQVSFTNAARLATYATPTFQRATAETRTLVQLELVNSASQQRDAAYVYFQAGATAGFDARFDAYKLPVSTNTYLALTAANEPLSVSGLALMGTADVTVPLTVAVATTGTYTLAAVQLLNLPAGKTAYLRDAQTGAVVNLAQQPAYSFTLNSASTSPRFEVVIGSRSLLATAPAALSAQISVYPNPARGQVQIELPTALRQQTLMLTLVNALGQTVKSMQLPASADARVLPLAGVAAGVYSISLVTNQGTVTKRLVVE